MLYIIAHIHAYSVTTTTGAPADAGGRGDTSLYSELRIDSRKNMFSCFTWLQNMSAYSAHPGSKKLPSVGGRSCAPGLREGRLAEAGRHLGGRHPFTDDCDYYVL